MAHPRLGLALAGGLALAAWLVLYTSPTYRGRQTSSASSTLKTGPTWRMSTLLALYRRGLIPGLADQNPAYIGTFPVHKRRTFTLRDIALNVATESGDPRPESIRYRREVERGPESLDRSGYTVVLRGHFTAGPWASFPSAAEAPRGTVLQFYLGADTAQIYDLSLGSRFHPEVSAGVTADPWQEITP